MNAVTPPESRHYFVDEAGDPTLFDARGRVLVGQEGCSRYFMMGALHVADPAALSLDLNGLRESLLSNPYFRGVPSMQAERRKTALVFHAKDDLPEVRLEVFKVLIRHDLKFTAVVRDKQSVLAYVRQRNQIDPSYRYQANELYDSLVARLFRNSLHLSPEVSVCFAERGRSDRSAALLKALQRARGRFEVQWNRSVPTNITARQASPVNEAALQATDYFLWALQRRYERAEGRFLEAIWSKIGLVHAVDEIDRALYGTYYTKKKPLR
jgi:hypothetical protein